MQIAYLIPEFPGQTHIFFWRERQALQRLGIGTHVVSTRRPPKAIVSHTWAENAASETFYLTEMRRHDILPIAIQFARFGPKAWIKAVSAWSTSAGGVSKKSRPFRSNLSSGLGTGI
jgi:hypothetical protein